MRRAKLKTIGTTQDPKIIGGNLLFKKKYFNALCENMVISIGCVKRVKGHNSPLKQW